MDEYQLRDVASPKTLLGTSEVIMSDKVFLFGFSRGAYSVRVLAALLHALGLMPRGNQNLLPYAMRLFKGSKGRRDDKDYSSRKTPKFGLFRHREIDDGAMIHSSTLRRIRELNRYKPPNLSEAFLATVRGLQDTPDELPYKK